MNSYKTGAVKSAGPLMGVPGKLRLDRRPLSELTSEELFSRLYGPVEESRTHRSVWEQRQDVYHRLRMRIRKSKTFPFTGCSNLRLPTAEKAVRKVAASRVQQTWGITPKSIAIPESVAAIESGYHIEKLLDWQMEQQIPDALTTLTICADKTSEKGFAVISPSWLMEDDSTTVTFDIGDVDPQEVETVLGMTTTPEEVAEWLGKHFDADTSETVIDENRDALLTAANAVLSGQNPVTISLKDELYNGPIWRFFDPEYVHVPTDSPINPQKCRWISLERYESIESLWVMAKRGQLDPSALEAIESDVNLSSVDQERSSTVQKDLQEGIDRMSNASHLVEVHEWYGWVEVEPGVVKKCFALIAPQFRRILNPGGKPIPIPFKHKKYPVVRFNNEVTDDRWYSSRGWPELLEDYIKEVDTQHNQKIDQQTIRNAPMFAFRAGVVNPRLVRFVPGQGIPVPGSTPLDDALKLLNNTNLNAEFSYEREEMLLKAEIQELVGHVDFGLQSLINRRQPRTAAEVYQQSTSLGALQTLDATLWADSIGELFTQTLQLDQQYLPEEVYATLTGRDGVEPLHITRDEIQGKYRIRARGNSTNTNPLVREQRSMQRIQMLLNPVNLQLGIVTFQNAFNMYRRWLLDQGELAWQQFITMPPPPPPPGPPPAMTVIKPKFEDLAPGEQAQVLLSGGIQPDVEGRAAEKGQELEELAMDHPELAMGGMEGMGGPGEMPGSNGNGMGGL